MKKTLRKMLLVALMFTAALAWASNKYYEATVKETVINENGVKGTYYDPVKHKEFSDIRASYEIGAFKPEKGKYGINCYDSAKTIGFIASIQSKFNIGDIIEVDGLKWKKTSDNSFEPHANPPEPVWDNRQEHLGQHIHDYAKWINEHPHLGYPPLPMDETEL